MNEIWIYHRDHRDGFPSFAHVCSSCVAPFINGELKLQVDNHGPELFGIEDALASGRRLAIRPSGLPDLLDGHLGGAIRATGVEVRVCDACGARVDVDHGERLRYAGRHAAALAAEGGELRVDCPSRMMTGYPWWFEYLRAYVACAEIGQVPRLDAARRAAQALDLTWDAATMSR